MIGVKKGSTIFLRAAVATMGLVVLAICVFLLPFGITSDETSYYYVPILWGLYVPAVPFFFALFQTVRLIGYIDKNTAFSNASIAALKRIKYCANVIALMFIAGLPYLYDVANRDDAPGVLVLALIIIAASAVIAVFASVLQHLLQSAIDIQSENDLTV